MHCGVDRRSMQSPEDLFSMLMSLTSHPQDGGGGSFLWQLKALFPASSAFDSSPGSHTQMISFALEEGCLHYTLSCVFFFFSFPRAINGHLPMKQMFRALGLAKINTDNLNPEVSGMFLVHFYFPTIKNDELEWTKVSLLLGQTEPSQTANWIATKPLLIKSTILSNYIIHKCLFCLVVKDDMNFYSYLAGNLAQWSKAWVLESKGLDPNQLLTSLFLWPWTHCLITLCLKQGYYHCI